MHQLHRLARKLTSTHRIVATLAAAAFLFAAPAFAASVQPAPPAAAPAAHDPWWKHAVIYEIYPRSFQDSNGDGIGDLPGITSRLDHLKTLGIDAIWISPMYPSPQVDFGYDISDYENVDPQYGTLRDMDRLIHEATQRHIHVCLDMVLNHTSDKHPWFIEAAASRTSPKHSWYVWSDGIPADAPGVTAYQKRLAQDSPNGKVVPPNNWVSLFGGSAWEWVPAVHQFFYHKFYRQQPDLNWDNPEVEKAMFGAMRFWLDRGIAGFRLDAIPELFEDQQLRSERELGGVNSQGDPVLEHTYTTNLPRVHDVIRRMRAMIDSYPGDRVLIGETYLPNTAELDTWYGGAAHNELQLPMDMLVGFHDNVENHDQPDAASFRAHIQEVETQVHGSQPLLVFDNHDRVRAIDRYAWNVTDPHLQDQINKLLATILFTSRATALMYYGEEIGMHTSTPTRREDVKDPIGITGWPVEKGRDGERTPMQWTPGPQAGFTSNPHPWLPVAADYKTVNVEVESREPGSQLQWFEQLIALRRDNPALHDGTLTMLDPTNSNVLSWVRTTGSGPAVVVAMNCTGQPRTITLHLTGSGVTGRTVTTLAADDPSLKATSTLTNITLPPYASWVAAIQ